MKRLLSMRPAGNYPVRLVSMCALVANALFAQARFQIAPAPAWVTATPIPAAPCFEADSTASIYLLADEQVEVESHAFYFHFAKKILSEETLEEGKYYDSGFYFNPAYQKLTLHHLKVWREGKAEDRLDPKLIEFESVAEDSVEADYYDESQWGTVSLDRLKVGDVIDYAFTLQGANPVWQNRFVHSFALQKYEPVCSSRFRLLVPKRRQLFFKNHNTALTPEKKDLGDVIEFVWQQHEVARPSYESYTPAWHDVSPQIQISEFENWRAVAGWATEYFRVGPALSPALQKKIAAIAAQSAKPEERVIAALHFVQNRIRTVYTPFGKVPRRPAAPGRVFAQGYGDCIEKTLLFCAVLQRLGIEAYPALVHTERRHTLEDWLPSPEAFNHAVAQVCLYQNVDKWFEPTAVQQGGTFWNVQFPKYDRALVVQPASDSLQNIAEKAYVNMSIDVKESFLLPGYETAAELRVTAAYDDAEADLLRHQLAFLDSAQRQEYFVGSYSASYPKTTLLEAVQIEDDTSANRLLTTAHYSIPDFWISKRDSNRFVGNFSAGRMWPYLAENFATMPRTSPLLFEHPVRVKYIITAELPEYVRVKTERGEVQDSAFEFKYEFWGGARLMLTYDYRSLAETIPAEKAEEHIANRKHAAEKIGYAITKPRLFRLAKPAKPARSFLWVVPALALAALAWYWFLPKLLRRQSKQRSAKEIQP